MATTQTTDATKDAAQQAVRLRTMIRSWKGDIDRTANYLAARVGELVADKILIDRALGTDSTRSDYTEQLQQLNRQRRRFQALLDALRDERL